MSPSDYPEIDQKLADVLCENPTSIEEGWSSPVDQDPLDSLVVVPDQKGHHALARDFPDAAICVHTVCWAFRASIWIFYRN